MKINKRSIRLITLVVASIFFIIALSSCTSQAPLAGLGGADSAHTVQLEEVREITIDEAYQLYQDKVAFLDVRTPEEWNVAHVPGATLLPLDDLEARVGELPNDLKLVVYCRSGNRSAEAARILMEAGFSDVYSVDGGLNDWIEAGYEVDPGD